MPRGAIEGTAQDVLAAELQNDPRWAQAAWTQLTEVIGQPSSCTKYVWRWEHSSHGCLVNLSRRPITFAMIWVTCDERPNVPLKCGEFATHADGVHSRKGSNLSKRIQHGPHVCFRARKVSDVSEAIEFIKTQMRSACEGVAEANRAEGNLVTDGGCNQGEPLGPISDAVDRQNGLSAARNASACDERSEMFNQTGYQASEVGDADILIESGSDDAPLDIAPQHRRVKTDKRDLPVETLQTWVARGKLHLQPMFQREFVWNKVKASRLIESLLLDIPIPVIYVAEEPDETLSVVDGQQRLTSIHAFIDGRFPDGQSFRLSSLQVLSELVGKSFKELPSPYQDKIMGAILRLIVIEKDSHPDVKFEVFERLNLGAERLNDQELRNSVYRGPYNALLKELAKDPYMLKVMRAKEPHKRMADRQLILRFFAMWRNTHLKYRGTMKQFLNREMEAHRHVEERELATMREVFERSIEMAWLVFGDNAFRRFSPGKDGNPDGSWEKTKLNVALWDTLLYTLSFYEKRQIVPIADRIREEFLDLLTNDTTFIEYITSSTDTIERVRYRGDEWGRRLQALVEVGSPEPRGFSRACKRRLYESNPACGICGQHIQDLDDAEVDHIEHYWQGGKTIPENARLSHRYCNRARGGR